MSRKLRATSTLLAGILMCATAHAAQKKTHPNQTDSDPVLTQAQLAALILQEYHKDDAKKLANDLLFLRGRRTSEVKKYFGDKTPGPTVKPTPTTPPSAPPPPTATSSCGISPYLFVRRDRLDTFQLREDAVPLSSAKGASISWTDDQHGGTKTLTVNGRVQYLMFGYDGLTPCNNGAVGNPYAPFDPYQAHYGYSFAPFIDAQGTTNSPMKKTETHNLQAGVDMQLSVLGGPIFDHQYLILTPYYQTDFAGVADVQGVRGSWEPVAPDIHLGGYFGVPDPYVGWFWQARGEIDEKHVSTVGFTGLARGNYLWFGGTAQLHLQFFPGRKDIDPFWVSPAPDLVDRFYSNVTFSSYWDSNSGRTASWLEGEVGFNLTTDGKSSISVKYDRGTDKDTLTYSKKYLLTLNYKQ
jgi:hypothetical protein